MHGVAAGRFSTIGFELAGPDAVAASLDDDAGLLLGDQGTSYLVRQLMSIAGGTTEMARNAIAERVLGMPRETSLDRGVPFRDVRHGS
jgi:alkylation response protein AidB-like acyl-CoA dehydrogenase